MTAARNERHASRGLTLVEFVLVLGVVAVLVAVAFSGWQAWRNRVMTQQAQNDIVAISVAVDDHIQEHGSPPDSLSDVGQGGLNDPWGRPYVYLNLSSAKGKGKARKDHSLVPLNSDYDLYSKGPDGESAAPLTAKSSRDDILRANNGRFVGPASMY